MGSRFEEVRRRIDAFLADWPDAEWGPAHVVLSDNNLEDYWIDHCTRQIEANERPDWMEPGDWPGENERTAIAAFLRSLKDVPEDDRCPN